MSLLGTAIASLFFLFAVSISNASFERMEQPFPDVFAPVKVVSVLDTAASGYSKFVYANLVLPAQQDYAFYADNISYAVAEASPAFMEMAGVSMPSVAQAMYQPRAQVAGASDQIVVSKYYPQSEGVFSIFYK